MNLLSDERLEPLGGNMSIVTSDSHTFGTDAVLLANFANIRRKDVACDMGTGCGIIPLIWCKGITNEVYGLDIQPKAISQLEKSLGVETNVCCKFTRASVKINSKDEAELFFFVSLKKIFFSFFICALWLVDLSSPNRD